MKEYSCRFGNTQRLIGIVTAPDRPSRRQAFVLVTAGLSPKSGPFRLYAELARRVARDGFLALRFDLGGIGDSRLEATSEPLETRTLSDIRSALDHLTETGEVDTFVLCGLCSGAEDAFRAAEGDPRVGGVVMIDPFSYKTRGWAWRHVVFRSKRRLLRLLGVYRPVLRAGKDTLVAYKYLDASASSRILRALLKRRVRVHFVYTGGVPRFNHPRQLKAMFPDVDFGGLVTLDYLAKVDHTQLLEEDRREIVEAIAQRLVPYRGAHPGAAESEVVLRGSAGVGDERRMAS